MKKQGLDVTVSGITTQLASSTSSTEDNSSSSNTTTIIIIASVVGGAAAVGALLLGLYVRSKSKVCDSDYHMAVWVATSSQVILHTLCAVC